MSVPGAMLYLLDENGASAATTMSSMSGAYQLTAESPGVYRIRVERIGFEGTVSPPIRLEDGDVYSYRVEASTDPIELQAIAVRADEGRCDVKPAIGEATYTLWNEARKALAATRWTVESGTLIFEQTLFARLVRAGDPPLREEVARAMALATAPDQSVLARPKVVARSVVTANPFTSAPVDSLESRGYAYGPDAEFYYYGPDAEVLLSDIFHTSHCFAIRSGRGRSLGLIGLRFEPDQRRDRVDIEGVLWLDPTTAELRYIDFEYVLEGRSFKDAGGEVNFEKLASNQFIIRSWAIQARDMSPGPPPVPGRAGVSQLDAAGVATAERFGTMRQEGGIITLIARRESYRVRRGALAGPPVELVEPHPDISGLGRPDRSERAIPGIVTRTLSLYRGPGTVSGVEDILRAEPEFAAATDAWSRALIGALWRRAGEPARALAAIDSTDALDARGPNRGVLALERARVLFDMGRTDEAGVSFDAACRNLNSDVKHQMWLDFRGLATPDEREAWPAVEPVPASCTLIRAFLIERARRMGVSLEERLQVHYDRLRHVREQYWLRRPRRQEGIADRLGRPDSLEVDDRGLVYLRMGEWDEWAGYLSASRPVVQNESWRYDDPSGPIVFHFAPVTRMTAGPAQVADYRLLDNLYMVLAVLQVDLLGAMAEFRGADGLNRLSELYLSRMGLDGRYATWAYRGTTHNATGMLSEFASEKELNVAAVTRVVQTVPDVPALHPRLAFAWQTLRFRNPGSDENVVWLLTSARIGDLESEDGKYRTRTEMRLRDGGRMRTETLEAEVPANGLDDDAGVVSRLAVKLDPGTYPFTLIVRDLNTSDPAIGNWTDGTVSASPFAPGLPDVSDLAIAADSGGAWTRDGEVFLAVEPAHVTSADGSIHVYFEVYGFRAGQAYDVDLRLVPEAQSERVYAVETDDVAFRLQFRGSMPDGSGGIGRHHLRLDLSDTDSGAYVLAIRVRDAVTTTPSLPATTPIVIP